MHEWGFGFGMFPFGWVLMLLFWGLVILGIVAIVRSLMGKSLLESGAPPESALDILKKRYARGEIEREEFERMKEDLKD